jgi:hypothetical protein
MRAIHGRIVLKTDEHLPSRVAADASVDARMKASVFLFDGHFQAVEPMHAREEVFSVGRPKRKDARAFAVPESVENVFDAFHFGRQFSVMDTMQT